VLNRLPSVIVTAVSLVRGNSIRHTVAMFDTQKPRQGGVALIGRADDVIALEPTDATQNAPSAGWVQVGVIEGAGVGIWEHTVGVSTDVEEDEVFVVLSGRATVVERGGTPTEFVPGDIGRLAAGTHTTWTVHEQMRKIWVAREDDSDG